MSDEQLVASCPYCFLTIDSSSALICESCGIPYHSDCWHSHGGCARYGCTNRIEVRTVHDETAAEDEAAVEPIRDPPEVAPETNPSWSLPSPPHPSAAVPTVSPPLPPPASFIATPRAPESPSAARSGVVEQLPPSWQPDPFGRHQHRFWDGRRWKALVADNGITSTDVYGNTPTPLPPPVGGASATAGWYADTSGRHQYRYWDRKRWTDQVADNGLQSHDPPTLDGRSQS